MALATYRISDILRDARKPPLKALERGVEGRDVAAGEVQLREASRRNSGASLGENIKARRRLRGAPHGGSGERVGR